jgi:pyruvate/2-oxoglutarate dehydrogenase complex dihydrolipoamide acyltransferase (E2) component
MSYRFEAKNRFFEANRSIVEYEIRPGNTVTFVSEVDLTQVERIRNGSRENRPTYTAFVAKAVALTLKEMPYANRRVCRRGWWPFAGKCLQAFDGFDVAVAAERDMPGIEYCAFADIIRNADSLSLEQMSTWLRNLATCDIDNNQQWREFSTLIKRLPRWLSSLLIRIPCWVPRMWERYRGGAVLISSPAKYGVDSVITTWTWPLGLSFGYVKQRPVVRNGQVVPAVTFNLVLNFDRRVMAGAQAARFFHRMVEILENAQQEMEPYLPKSEPVVRGTVPPVASAANPAIPTH